MSEIPAHIELPQAMRPATGSLEAWNAAYVRVEDYLRAHRIHNRLHQLRLIQEQPISDDELSQTKKYLVGSFPLKFDTLGKIDSFMLQVELYGLGLDYPDRYPKLIEAITRDDVMAGAKKYLHPDAAILVVVANQQEANIKVESLLPH